MIRSAARRAARVADAAWDTLVALAATGAAVAVPLTLLPGFVDADTSAAIEFALTLLFGTDVVVRAHRVRARGGSAWDWASVALDVVAAIPWWLVGPAWLLLLRLVKLARVAGGMRSVGRHFPGLAPRLRLVTFAYWLVLTVHLVACGFLALGAVPDGSPATRYTEAAYWGVSTLTTVGYGDVLPTNSLQKLYAIGVMLLGVGLYAFLVGNIASLITNLDPLRAAHVQQSERLDAFMRYRGLPMPLRQRVRTYLDYVWEERLVVDEEATLAVLPPGLRQEVSLHLRHDLVRGVPLFAGAPHAFVREVALQMHSFVALPGDVIVQAGERGFEMYVLSRGAVEILGPDGQRMGTLASGEFFGEIALVEDTVRTATVRALVASDLYVLDRALFERTIAAYPGVTAALREAATRRRESDQTDQRA